MFESLSARLQGVVDRLRGKAKITEADLDVALREIRLALLEADVNFRVVKEFVARVRERALGADLRTDLNPGQQVVKNVHAELVSTLAATPWPLAMTGQEAVRVAEAFHARLPLTGLVLTKMDGDARGGAALSIRSVTGIPIVYLGTGERPDGLEAFHPDRLAQRILGMGDVLSLVERVQETVDREEAERVAQRMMEARFSLEDFRGQLQQIKKLGPIGQLVQMIPGAGQMAGAAQAAVDNGELRRIEALIDSMTVEERQHPELIKASRRRRIATGSGTSTADVNRLLKQFEEMQRLMRSLGGGRLPAGNALRGLLGGR